MISRLKSVIGFLIVGAILVIIDIAILPDSFIGEAEARVGRPLTPVSFAGVARRTARRTVYAASTVYIAPPVTTTTIVVVDNSYEEQQTAEAQQQAAYAQQQAAQAQQQAILPVGATLPTLPAGCSSKTVNELSYFSCGGNWYRPAMQNGNIVYAVVADPR